LIGKNGEVAERVVSQFEFLVAMQSGASRSRADRPRVAGSGTAASGVVSRAQ